MQSEAAIGVIGGSGLYELDGLERIERIEVKTPFGDPSDVLMQGWLHGQRMVFLPRHGVGHKILPSEIPFLANIWAMKSLDVSRIVSVSAVGSMKESIEPGHLVLVDQFIDRTRQRPPTFYGNGVVVHVPFAEPICPALRSKLFEASKNVKATVHNGGTYICIEGPQFSTRAESLLYRSWGVDVVGMTNCPEAKLAREAEISYATVALSTDYDCWHASEDEVSVAAVLATLKANVDKAKALLVELLKLPKGNDTSEIAQTAARTSLMSDPSAIPQAQREALDPIFRHFLPASKES